MWKSRCREDKTVLPLIKSTPIETLQWPYTMIHREHSQNKRSERLVLSSWIFPLSSISWFGVVSKILTWSGCLVVSWQLVCYMLWLAQGILDYSHSRPALCHEVWWLLLVVSVSLLNEGHSAYFHLEEKLNADVRLTPCIHTWSCRAYAQMSWTIRHIKADWRTDRQTHYQVHYLPATCTVNNKSWLVQQLISRKSQVDQWWND